MSMLVDFQDGPYAGMRYRVILRSGRCWHTSFERGPRITALGTHFATVVAIEDGDTTPVNVSLAADAIESITDMDCG